MELYSVVLMYRKTENGDKNNMRTFNRPIGIYENKTIAIGSGIMELSKYCKSTIYDDEFIKICLPKDNKDDNTIYFEAVFTDNERKVTDILASIWIMPVEDTYVCVDFHK